MAMVTLGRRMKMKRLLIYSAALAILGAVLCAVSQTGGLPEPYGSLIGQTLSHSIDVIYLTLCGVFLVFGPLRHKESRPVRLAWVAGSVALNFAVVQLLKKLVFWARPVDVGEIASTASRGSGFPSGHTVPAFLIAVLVGYIEPRLQIPALVVAGLIGYSRAEVTAHFPIQVWLSALIGILLGVVCTTIYDRITKQRRDLAD